MGIPLSQEALRQLLIDTGLSHQRTRSWKWSPDPEFRFKAERVLCSTGPNPRTGSSSASTRWDHNPVDPPPRRELDASAATRTAACDLQAPHGVRYLLAAYDVHSDRLHGRLREHKNAGEVLAFFKQIRMRYSPKLRIYLVMDNLSTHKTEAIREWGENNNVELVFTPTYASFLNRIKCHFWAIGEFVVKNADYPDRETLASAMAQQIRYRAATAG
jgi:transposase